MPAFNFQPRFADLVESGAKTQTIRKTCRAKIGDTVYLYTGQRTKRCRKLGEGVVTGVHWFHLRRDRESRPYMLIGSLPLTFSHMDDFARRDGFRSAQEMVDWFQNVHGLPFNGWLINWELRK